MDSIRRPEAQPDLFETGLKPDLISDRPESHRADLAQFQPYTYISLSKPHNDRSLMLLNALYIIIGRPSSRA